MRILIIASALSLVGPSALAQSIVTGAIAGTVRDELGQTMPDAHVILIERGTGVQRDRETGAGGGFHFLFLPPGTYDVTAEQLGYRPTQVRGIPVGPGRETAVTIDLAPVPPPVDSVAVVGFSGGMLGLSGASWERRFGELELQRLADQGRELAELARYSSVTLGGLAADGLPGRFTGILIDGIPYSGTYHPALPDAPFTTTSFPQSQFTSAGFMSNPVDVEYGDAAGALLEARTLRGTRELEVSAFGDWSNERLANSGHFNPDGISHMLLRGGAVVTGPLIRDTAHFVVGAEARRLETPFPRAWAITDQDSVLLAVASDSFGVDLGGYVRPRLAKTDVLSAFGRFDGQISERNGITLRADFAQLSSENAGVAQRPYAGLGTKLDGTDVNGAFQFTSSLTAGVGMEFRLGVEYSKREYRAGELPGTVLTDGPVVFGSDPAIPGRFERLAVRASETVLLALGSHQFKVGGSMVVGSIDEAPSFQRAGAFTFGGVDEFAVLNGSFVQSVGPRPSAQFRMSEYGGFLQDRWSAAPGLELTLGFRLDGEVLPDGEIPGNAAWFQRTGIANTQFDRNIVKFSPRFGLRWDVNNRHRWLVRGQAGLHFGMVDPSAYAAAVTQSGAVRVRRGLGFLGRWIATPDSVVAPVGGPVLTLPGSGFEAPRTFKTALGITFALGSATELDVSANYRHTDFLIRRRDLNLLPARAGQDQFGRPVYGRLVQQGSSLTALPGSNRRFTDFDVVNVLNADGVSDYWGLTVRFGHTVDFLEFSGSYTFSKTEDNVPWRGPPDAALTPFPRGLENRDWLDGVSDSDVPHRLAIGAEVRLAMVRLAGFFRYQSGLPFTPGFREGVDANGDGSASNDPAFVDDGVPGVADLLSKWDCLAEQVGRFAKRNSCRTDPTNTLDVRVAVRILATPRYTVELTADGMNLLDINDRRPDRAVYLVDPAGTLTTDPSTGNVTVPLIANPHFGRTAHSFATGRFVRVGVKVRS